MADIYALLIGINGYAGKPLNGCIQDVDDIENYLENNHSTGGGVKLKIRRLTDKSDASGNLLDTLPTRDNLIKAFDFFDEVKDDDFCLIYYSGHGSYSAAPKEFWTETDGFNESFVCLDSREPGGRDLMDKEMAFLLWKTFSGKPDVTVIVITDCCHSGNITKGILAVQDGVKDRLMPAGNIPRIVEEYYGFGEKVNGKEGYVSSDNGTRVTVKEQRHIHLAASQENQTSKERSLGGAVRGAFTYCLLQVLNNTGGRVSYRQLIDKTIIAVALNASDQVPGIGVNGVVDPRQRTAEINKYFLSHTEATKNSGHNVFYTPLGWCIDAGSVHGVGKGDAVQIENMFNTVVVRTLADRSVISGKPELQRGTTYAATILPGMWKPLTLSFAPNVSANVRALIIQALQALKASLVSIEDSGTYIIRPVDDKFSIFLGGSDQPVMEPENINDTTSAELFIRQMEEISRWRNFLQLANPTSTITTKHYALTLHIADKPGDYSAGNFKPADTKPVHDLLYKNSNGTWYAPAIKLSLKNNTDKPLWFTCVYMLFNFGILGNYYESVLAAPHMPVNLTYYDEGTGFRTDVLDIQLEDKYVKKGFSEIREYLKVFISTDKMDLKDLNQDGIEQAAVVKRGVDDERVAKGSSEEEKLSIVARKDWATETIGMRIIKPAEQKAIDRAPGN